MPDENENNIAISELDEALDLTDSAQFPYTQNNGGTLTTFKARLTQIAAKIIEGLSFAGINLPTSAGDKTVENSINFLLDSVGGDPNGNISDSYDPTTAYVKGDLCIYENVLYICTAPTTGTFDPSKWTATTIDNVIGSLSTLTTTDKSSIVGAVNSIYPTKDIGGTAKGVNATYQIPAGVLAHSIITIALRRYAYAGEVTILAENITAGAYTNGLTVFGAHDKYAEFSISTTGLITITAISNWAEVYIDLIGIF